MNGGPRAQLVVDTAGKYELTVETTSGGWLDVKQLKLPVDDGGV